MIADPRYPVGRWSPPDHFRAADTGTWRRELAALPEAMRQAVSGLDDVQLDTAYRDGGWTVRQVVHHVVDSHFNSYCRFKLALTENNPIIKPYDEAAWAELADSRLPIAPSLAMLDGLHARWIGLLDAMSDADWERTFAHPERPQPMSLWQAASLYSWHSRHHVGHITALREGRGWR